MPTGRSGDPITLSGRRRERLPFLDNIGDQDPRLLVAVLAAGMWRFGRNLEAIAWLQRTDWLTFYREIQAAFKDIAGFYSRMFVPSDCHSRFYFRLHK